jgi:hypothetical protein
VPKASARSLAARAKSACTRPATGDNSLRARARAAAWLWMACAEGTAGGDGTAVVGAVRGTAPVVERGASGRPSAGAPPAPREARTAQATAPAAKRPAITAAAASNRPALTARIGTLPPHWPPAAGLTVMACDPSCFQLAIKGPSGTFSATDPSMGLLTYT